MTRDEYEQSKTRIEEQHRAAVELMEIARKAQLRALDLVWMVQNEEGIVGREAVSAFTPPAAPAPVKQEAHPPPEPPAAPPPAQPRRKSSPEVETDIVDVYYQLPEKFTRHDVRKLLHYEPERAALDRSLRSLVKRKLLRVEEAGTGHRATRYRRTPETIAAGS